MENCPWVIFHISFIPRLIFKTIFTPVDVLISAERRNYRNVFDALLRITREEGFFKMWRGAIPTMGRAMVVNAAQLASYSQAKQSLMKTGNETRVMQALSTQLKLRPFCRVLPREYCFAFLCIHDIWASHNCGFHARGHCQNSVKNHI